MTAGTAKASTLAVCHGPVHDASYVSFREWALLTEQLEHTPLGPLASPLATEDQDSAETED
ncbi:hypothetical protein V8E53_002870 [Lactarius tabidus]